MARKLFTIFKHLPNSIGTGIGSGNKNNVADTHPTTRHIRKETFVKNYAFQCGYCTPGMVMTSYALLQRNPNPSEEEIRKALAGNLCMCTGYVQIVEAVKEAARGSKNG